jgi:hypothetical protein
MTTAKARAKAKAKADRLKRKPVATTATAKPTALLYSVHPSDVVTCAAASSILIGV